VFGVFNKRLELTFRTHEADGGAARIINFQNWLSTNRTQESFVPFYRH